MTTKTKEYVLIETIDYYGPRTEHQLATGKYGEDLPTYDSSEDAEAAIPDESGPMYLGHNESGHRTTVWEVERDVEPSDWDSWPADVRAAAIEAVEEAGIEPDDSDAIDMAGTDWLADAAQACGKCVVAGHFDGEYRVVVCTECAA